MGPEIQQRDPAILHQSMGVAGLGSGFAADSKSGRPLLYVVAATEIIGTCIISVLLCPEDVLI